MAPHSSTLAWKIPWMEEPGRLQSMVIWGICVCCETGRQEEALLGLRFFPSLFANHRAFQSEPVYEVCIVSISVCVMTSALVGASDSG